MAKTNVVSLTQPQERNYTKIVHNEAKTIFELRINANKSGDEDAFVNCFDVHNFSDEMLEHPRATKSLKLYYPKAAGWGTISLRDFLELAHAGKFKIRGHNRYRDCYWVVPLESVKHKITFIQPEYERLENDTIVGIGKIFKAKKLHRYAFEELKSSSKSDDMLCASLANRVQGIFGSRKIAMIIETEEGVGRTGKAKPAVTAVEVFEILEGE